MDYLVRPIEGADHLCIGVKALKNVILGAVLLRNYDVFFDRTDHKVGFARSNCGKDVDYFENYPGDYDKEIKLRDIKRNTTLAHVVSKVRKKKKAKNKHKKKKIFNQALN